MSSRASIACLLVACLCVAWACADDSGSRATESVIPEWRLELEGRIGSLDDPDELLDNVDQVVIGPDGQLFVPQATEIWVYDVAGARVGTIGREGEGPGEFGSVSHIGLVGGDTLYATQSGQIGYFSLDGQFLTSTRLTAETVIQSGRFFEPGIPMTLVPLPDGGSIMTPGIAVIGPRPEPGINTRDSRWPVFRLDASSAIQDTVVWQGGITTVVGVIHEGRVSAFGSPFDEGLLTELVPDGSGVVVVDRAAAPNLEPFTYRVSLIDPDRDTVFSTGVTYEPVAVSAQRLAEEVSERMEGRPTDGPSPAAIEGALRDADLIPPALPPVTDLAVGQDRTVWIKREETLADSVLWQVLDRAGQLQGQLYLPAAQTVVAAQGDLMVAVELDALDVPYIVRYRILR